MRRLCLVEWCEHRDEPGWIHHVPPRQTPVLAHLRFTAEERAA